MTLFARAFRLSVEFEWVVKKTFEFVSGPYGTDFSFWLASAKKSNWGMFKIKISNH